MKINQGTHVSDKLLAEIIGLIPQLTGSARPLSEVELRTIIDSDATDLTVGNRRKPSLWDANARGVPHSNRGARLG